MKKKLLSISFALIASLAVAQIPADALNFDGINDYVLLPSTIPSVGNNDCTFEAWVYPKLNSTALQMILAKDQFGDPNSQLRFAYISGTFRFSMSDMSGTASLVNLTSGSCPINNWYHVAAVRQGSVFTLYINGAVATTSTSSVPINNNNPSHAWSIGCRKPFAQDPFNGSIDELRIWNVARTKCEINTYKNCEIPTSALGLIANFHFNQGISNSANLSVTSLIDNSASANTGTLVNFALSGTSSNWVIPGGVTTGSFTPLPPISITASVSNSSVCSGLTTTFTASGANTYTWTGGVVNGASFTPNTTSDYTVTGTNTLTGCSNTAVTSVSVLPSPTVTVNSGSLCSNYAFTLSPSGAVSYTYSSGTAVVSPTSTSSYTVVGAAANGCIDSAVSSVTVIPSPNVFAFSSQTAICAGESVALNGAGAVSYSWNGTASASNITVTPLTNTVYILTGAGTNLCETSKTINITVYPLPNLTITPSRAIFCVGEKIILTGSGATSYTWVTQGVISSSIQVQPTVTTNYTVKGKDTQSCVNSQTFQLIASPCTGIGQNQIAMKALNIYPNPNNGMFSIQSTENMTLNLINELGQLVREFSLNDSNQRVVRISDLHTGIYFVIGSNENSIIKEKIIVTN